MLRPEVAGPVWILLSKLFMDGLAPLFKMCGLVEVRGWGSWGGGQGRSPIVLGFGFQPISPDNWKSLAYPSGQRKKCSRK